MMNIEIKSAIEQSLNTLDNDDNIFFYHQKISDEPFNIETNMEIPALSKIIQSLLLTVKLQAGEGEFDETLRKILQFVDEVQLNISPQGNNTVN